MINLVKIARLLVSILFIFSGISKIISLDFFDGLVAELLIGPEFYDEPGKFIGIQIFTRVLISFEIMQGVALLQNWKIRKLIIPSILLILVLFTIHLFYEGFNKGFDGNCGCFGDVLPLSNGASIIKNIVAMLLAGFVWKNYIPNHKLSHFPSWVASATIAAVTLFTLSFGVKDYSIIKKNEEPKVEIIDTAQSIKIPIIDTILEVDTPAVTNAKLKIDNSTTTTFEKPRDTIKTIKTKVVETKPKRVLTPKSEKTISLLENYPRFSNECYGLFLIPKTVLAFLYYPDHYFYFFFVSILTDCSKKTEIRGLFLNIYRLSVLYGGYELNCRFFEQRREIIFL